MADSFSEARDIFQRFEREVQRMQRAQDRRVAAEAEVKRITQKFLTEELSAYKVQEYSADLVRAQRTVERAEDITAKAMDRMAEIREEFYETQVPLIN